MECIESVGPDLFALESDRWCPRFEFLSAAALGPVQELDKSQQQVSPRQARTFWEVWEQWQCIRRLRRQAGNLMGQTGASVLKECLRQWMEVRGCSGLIYCSRHRSETFAGWYKGLWRTQYNDSGSCRLGSDHQRMLLGCNCSVVVEDLQMRAVLQVRGHIVNRCGTCA